MSQTVTECLKKTRKSRKAERIFNALIKLCMDDTQKAADRIAAAKLYLSYCYDQREDTADTLKGIFEGETPGYLD